MPTSEWDNGVSELVEILSASSGEALLSTLLDECGNTLREQLWRLSFDRAVMVTLLNGR